MMESFKEISTKEETPITAVKMFNLYGEQSLSIINLIKDNMPMYIGELNPKWKYWDDVYNIILKGVKIENVEIKQTERGFDYTDFKDCNDNKCSIQISSSAMEDRIWFGSNDIGLKKFIPYVGWEDVELEDTPGGVSHIANNRMHLNREMVRQLLPVLYNFAINGEIE